MLELIALLVVCRRIGRLAAEHGRSKIKYQLAAIGLWFAGEFFFGFLGSILHFVFDLPQALVYLMAIAGGIAGAITAFYLVKRPDPIPVTPPPLPPKFD